MAGALPPLKYYFGEALLPLNWLRGKQAAGELANKWPGDGRTVLVIPGLGVDDSATHLLRSVLTQAGYNALGWGLGRAGPIKPDLFDRMDVKIDQIIKQAGSPITLLGWSLGGVIARDYAHHAPEKIKEVITLGSPFSGDPRTNRAWRIYELMADHPVDRPPLGGKYAIKPPMPTTAIWSRCDGVIPEAAARGLPDQSDQSIEIDCGHFSMSSAPIAIEAVLQALAGSDAIHRQ
jgi:pimeloyl-ACP methyl ester carboxylesterase